jgi:hypothetical protein
MSPRLLRPRAPSGFNPKTIAGLSAWLDAADTSTTTLNGSTVSEWRDKSGRGIAATQPTALNQPDSTGSINGRRALLFNGSSNYMTCSGGSFANQTFFMVARRGASGSSRGAIFSYRASASDLTSNSDSAFTLTYGTAAQENLGFDPITGTPTLFRNGASVARGTVAGITANSYSTAPFPNTTDAVLLTINSGSSLAGAKNFAICCDSFSGGAIRPYAATVGEVLIYNRVLSATEIATVERYLAAKWGVTLIVPPTASNADAQAWITAVYANGGLVSTATANAVNTFCTSIESAGIRDRFYRLNLFAGSNLSAALVPLFRGPSLGGTQFGNTTDTNDNFVSGDYTETGTSGGLGTGATNSTKSLDTGLIPFNAGITHDNSHLCFYSRGGNTTTGAVIASGRSTAPQELLQWFINGSTGSVGQFYRSGGPTNSGMEGPSALRTGHMIAQRSGSGGAMYRNGSNLSLTSTTSSGVTFATGLPPAMRVFARNLQGAVDQRIATTLQGYSIGVAFTDSQASSYYTAMQALQTELGRQL